MIYKTPLLILSLFPLVSLAADRHATGDDGREIRLKDNGQWEYQSSDRFASSDDGSRVRLKEDGSWTFIGNAPIASKEQVRTESLDVKLDKIVTEFHKQKVGKNVRFDSQTVFYLNVGVSSYSQGINPKLSHFNLFKAYDSRGNDYPIIAISPQQKNLQPGQKITLEIRVDGSPSGAFAVGIKHLYLDINKAVFGTVDTLKFSKRTDELKKIKKNTPF